MQKVLLSLPEGLVSRMRALVPDRQRSRFITRLVEEELKRREEELYRIAREVEQDESLRVEMADWDVTAADGADHEAW